jgi:hypothetical protein
LKAERGEELKVERGEESDLKISRGRRREERS